MCSDNGNDNDDDDDDGDDVAGNIAPRPDAAQALETKRSAKSRKMKGVTTSDKRLEFLTFIRPYALM